MNLKEGDKIRATPDCVHDFAEGEGIVTDVRGECFRIIITKECRGYKVGETTPQTDWQYAGVGEVVVELIGDTPVPVVELTDRWRVHGETIQSTTE